MDFKDHPQADFKPIDELTKKQAEEEVEALREGLAYHDRLYDVANDPQVSDSRYDELFARLQALEDAFPDLQSATSPTRRVGAPPAGGLVRVEHSAPMLSLDAALEQERIEEFFAFVRRNTGRNDLAWVAEPKFDGVSVEVIYEAGAFRAAATRGDGETGEEVSANLATIHSLPLRLRGDDIPGRLAVRGEVFLPKQAFQELNRKRVENNREPYANPRNACAGTIRRLESKIVAAWPLDIRFYDILDCDGRSFASHWMALQAFESWGLKTDPLNRKVTGLKQLASYREELAERREELDYEIDGVVVKLDDLTQRNELGTRQRSPRWAMAWKFESKKKITTLEKIVVQVGTSGILTPVALLAPVDISGVTVSRATLHNENEVAEKDLREGDKVRIERAGDVIPEVVERVERTNKYAHTFHMPETCPSCDTETIREGAYVLCPAGLSCPAQLRGRIRHFGTREALDIDHLGEKTAGQLVEMGLVETLVDLYRLTAEDFKKLEGFSDKSAKNLEDAIKACYRPRFDRFLNALGIRLVGQRISRLLAEKFKTLDRLRAADEEQLRGIDQIGPEIARSLVRFFDENHDVLEGLEEAGVDVQAMPEDDNDGPLAGKTFVFSGALEKMTRDEAQRLVAKRGGRATSSVSGRTDYLVVGDDPGQKREDAEALDVEIIDEEAFCKRLEDS